MNEFAIKTLQPVTPWRTTWRDTGYLVVVTVLLAFSSNAIRSDRLPVIADKEFDILVPCAEPLGSTVALSTADPRILDPRTLIIDARSIEEYRDWHLKGAKNVPFDWIAEQDEVTKQAQAVARDVARTGRRAVVVYGDGADPDSGQQWAALLNTAGIRNVYYVAGGSRALQGQTPDREAR